MATVAAVSAQVTKKPLPAVRKVPVAPTGTKDGEVILNGDASFYDNVKKIGRFNGNVRVSQIGKDLNLFAQQVLYNENTNEARATGDLVATTPSSTIRGTLVLADFDAKIINITGNVTVTTHGKKDGIIGNRADLRTDLKSKPSTIRCERVEWNYEDGQATLTGNIRMTQGASYGTCEKILYDEEKNVAQLVGRVSFTDKENRTFNTPDLTLYIDDEKIVTKGGRIRIPHATDPKAPPRTTRPKVLNVQPPPSISEDDTKIFGIAPPPIPTPRPEPTEAPQPTSPPPEPEEVTESPVPQN